MIHVNRSLPAPNRPLFMCSRTEQERKGHAVEREGREVGCCRRLFITNIILHILSAGGEDVM